MRNSIIVNFLLTLVFMLVVLHQWIGWKADGHEVKNESLAFDKEKCLIQLNANGKKRNHPGTPCHKFYLRDDLEDKPTAWIGFCISPFTKYLTLEMGQACGMEGFWIHHQNECVQTFVPVPVSDEVILKIVMREIGFAQFVPFAKVPRASAPRRAFLFFRDTCTFDKKGRALKCRTAEKDEYVYPLSPHPVCF